MFFSWISGDNSENHIRLLVLLALGLLAWFASEPATYWHASDRLPQVIFLLWKPGGDHGRGLGEGERLKFLMESTSNECICSYIQNETFWMLCSRYKKQGKVWWGPSIEPCSAVCRFMFLESLAVRPSTVTVCSVQVVTTSPIYPTHPADSYCSRSNLAPNMHF